MRIATWNVNGIRARLDFVLHWLRARKPDLVGLQELKVSDESFPYSEFEAEGYSAVIHSQKAWNGVAILSRDPVEVRQQGLPGQEGFGARLVAVETVGLSFVTVYCPNGKRLGHADFARKLVWFDDLLIHIQTCYDAFESVVLCGDFNICPSSLDTWNEEALKGQIFHTKEERDRFEAFLKWGFLDIYRAVFPEKQAFSWWDYRAGAFHKNQGLRIDFLLGTSSVRERVRRVEIDRDYRKKKEGLTASDHAPVIADLD